MAQFFDVLSPADKGQEQQFFNNVEEQTVQYVITPDKTQVQYPQQIVVTTGEQISQLMVVDAQPQQILIDQSTITYQGQTIQQQTQVQPAQVSQQQIIQQQVVPQQVQQYAVIQDGTLNNGTQQIFFMDSNNTTERVVVEAQASPQPIVLNHQIGQTSIRLARPAQPVQQTIRATVRQPVLQQQRPPVRLPTRSPNPNQQSPRPINAVNQAQIRATTPGQVQIRPVNPNQVQVRQQSPNPSPVRQPNPNQQQPLRQPMGNNQVRIPTPQNQQQQPLRSMTRIPTQQFKPQNPGQVSVRQLNQQVRQLVGGQQVRQNSPAGVQPKIPGQIIRTPGGVGIRFPNLQQLQAKANSQDIDLTEEIKSCDEQKAAMLPDGSTVSIAGYKKLFNDIKQKMMQQKVNIPNSNSPALPPAPAPTVVQTPISTTKRRNPPKPRQPTAKQSAAAQRNTKAITTANIAQFGSPVQQQQPQQQQQVNNNDPSRYAMMSQAQNPQQQQLNKQPPTPYPPQLPQQQLLQQQRQQLQQQPQQQQIPPQQPQQTKPSQANYVIQPPKMNQKRPQKRPLPSYIPSSQIQKIIAESTPVSEEFSDSIRMLVLLENGEQRLITFTLPKEACTIQEILEQVNVPFQSNTNIQVTEANSSGINYIVTVGNVHTLGFEDDDDDDVSMPETPIPPLPPPPTPPHLSMSPPPPPPPSLLQSVKQAIDVHIPRTPSPEHDSPTKEIPKYVPGMWALCGMCGYLSEDFAKCIRCQRKLPESVKAIPATVKNGPKRESGTPPQPGQQLQQPLQQQSQQQQPQQQQPLQQQPGNPSNKANCIPNISPVNPKGSVGNSPKKKSAKSKAAEVESVHVISSDEEDEEKPSKVSANILQKLGSSVTICPISKEPSPNDIQRLCAALKNKTSVTPESQESPAVSTTVLCRTVRIGSYRCIPVEKKVIVDSKQLVMRVPHPSIEKLIKTIKIEKKDVVKVLASFNVALPVFFYYVNPDLAKTICEELGMTVDGDYYYDPLSTEEEAFRRITLLPDDVGDNDKDIFQVIYGGPPNLIDELNVKEANDILIKTCPKELTKATLGLGAFTEIKQLLTYPPEGRYRISINTEDYVCLAQDQFLNDVIIDFYLKYLVEHLPDVQKPKVHVFSTFFYKRLTTKPVKASRKSQPAELDPTLNAAQKRHARVKTWTKNVNLFEKDFIIVPINENAHWFLAIICFAGMDGPQTWDGKSYVIEVKKTTKKKVKTSPTPTVSVTVKQEKEKPIVCEDPDVSDKDEAEGDDSELESDDSEELPLSQNSTNSTTPSESPPEPVTPPPAPTPAPSRSKKEPRPPIKQPCILIFDSLAGANRARVVATLRDYLTCEHMAKLGKEKIYNRDIIKGANPKVPQQNNFTDCGLYVLQYVEQFFKDPIKDYHIPIKQIQNWFEELVVTKKREDIAILIKSLMREYGKDTRMLPEIIFPTLNGKLVEREFDDEEEEEEDEEEMMEDEEEPPSPTGATHDSESEVAKEESFTSIKSLSSGEMFSNSDDAKSDENSSSPEKPLSHAASGDFVTQTVTDLKPDLREFPRQSNKDTLSILKAKRIIRHKNLDGPELKKLKSD